jgi:benzodiazapine receptor
MSFHIPNILLAIPRNPVTAVGLPLALGFLSASQTSKVANSNWYHVGARS